MIYTKYSLILVDSNSINMAIGKDQFKVVIRINALMPKNLEKIKIEIKVVCINTIRKRLAGIKSGLFIGPDKYPQTITSSVTRLFKINAHWFSFSFFI